MILPHVQAVLGLDAFVGDPRPHDFGEPIDIHRVHGEGILDLRAHGIGPRLGAENPDLQRGFSRIELLGTELVEDRQHVGRRHHDDVGLEIEDELHLALGHAAGDRDHAAAEPLRAVVRAEPAGEQTIAVGDVHLHAGFAARGADRARHEIRPGVDVAARVADDGGLAGGAGRGVDANDVFLRNREHAERVMFPQILLGGERKAGKIAELAQIVGTDARRLEFLAVRGDVVIGMAQRPSQAIELQRRDFVARGLLDRLEAERDIGRVDHSELRAQGFARAGPRGFRPGTISPSMAREFPRNSAMTKPSSRVTVTS